MLPKRQLAGAYRRGGVPLLARSGTQRIGRPAFEQVVAERAFAELRQAFQMLRLP
jgi:hypothetical protein